MKNERTDSFCTCNRTTESYQRVLVSKGHCRSDPSRLGSIQDTPEPQARGKYVAVKEEMECRDGRMEEEDHVESSCKGRTLEPCESAFLVPRVAIAFSPVVRFSFVPPVRENDGGTRADS